MKKQPPTYDNDRDAYNLSNTFVTDDSLLEFIFKKGGKVNVSNITYILGQYGHKQQVAQNFVNLNAAGLIEYYGSIMAKVTLKARWERFRDSENIKWVLVVIGILLAVLALR